MLPHDLASLTLFAAVVEHRNIAAAARATNIAQSAASKRISDLEVRCGSTLFHRLRDGVAPNLAGETLYAHVKRIQKILAEADAELEAYSRGAGGHIRLWSNWSAVAQFLPKDLAQYAQRRSDVRIELKTEVSGAIVAAVASGDADIGIYSDHIGQTDLCERVYRRDTLVVIAPQGHPIARQNKVTLRELGEHPFIALGGSSTLGARLVGEMATVGLSLRIKMEVMDFDAVRGLVAAGLGISVLPDGAVTPYLAGELSLISVPLDEPWAIRSLMVGVRSEYDLTVPARDLLESLAPHP